MGCTQIIIDQLLDPLDCRALDKDALLVTQNISVVIEGKCRLVELIFDFQTSQFDLQLLDDSCCLPEGDDLERLFFSAYAKLQEMIYLLDKPLEEGGGNPKREHYSLSVHPTIH